MTFKRDVECKISNYPPKAVAFFRGRLLIIYNAFVIAKVKRAGHIADQADVCCLKNERSYQSFPRLIDTTDSMTYQPDLIMFDEESSATVSHELHARSPRHLRLLSRLQSVSNGPMQHDDVVRIIVSKDPLHNMMPAGDLGPTTPSEIEDPLLASKVFGSHDEVGIRGVVGSVIRMGVRVGCGSDIRCAVESLEESLQLGVRGRERHVRG